MMITPFPGCVSFKSSNSTALYYSRKMQFETGFGVDPLFPASGEVSKCNGFYFNYEHGGIEARKWLDENFVARPDDIYVASFPKTGTTWAQEMVYVIGNDLNFEKAKSKLLTIRSPFIEFRETGETTVIADLDVEKSRFLKTHYPYSLLPKSIVDENCKIVYTIRNPKDTVVSFYHFAKINPWIDFQGDFKTFFNLFITGERIIYGPYSKHILEYWEHRHQDNILILFYEDMSKDPATAVGRVASFLGKSLTEKQVEQVVQHCSFDSMRKNPTTNCADEMDGFMRKGKVGDWKNYFTDDMNKKMDEYIERHFAGIGLKFDFDA